MNQVLIAKDELDKLLAMDRLGRARNANDPRPKSTNQAVATPPDLLKAVQERYGRIVVDLAASGVNAVCDRYIGDPRSEDLGGRCIALDALSTATEWPETPRDQWLWLNPPYANILPWVERCAAEVVRGRQILLLVPAAVGSCWFGKCVQGFAYVEFLNPRPQFVGYPNSAGKDHMLCAYRGKPGFKLRSRQWIWKQTRRNSA